MAGRSVGPPTGPRYIPSPRRQVAVRLPTSVPAASGRSSDANYAVAVLPEREDINPKIAEIQLRVEELVRRYDDAVAAVDDEDDSFETRTPARWRVGDVLLATHRALARTSTHAERTIISDFGDDPEVSNAIGKGAQKVEHAFTEATEQAARRHERLSHIHHALQSVAANGFSLEDEVEHEEEEKTSPYASREHQLRSTIDALHREKDSMATQLQDALRMQQESRVALEQQAQELTKAQRQLRMQAEELRITHENNEKAAETANALTASWREKFQGSTKAAAAAEAKVQELEMKVRLQSEEIVKHTFVLQTKIQEMERLKEAEAARSRAEAAAQAAALAEAEAEAKKAKAKMVEQKRKTKMSVDDSNKDLREMENKVRELEGTLLAMENTKQELEKENADLVRRVKEIQGRFGEQRKTILMEEAKQKSAPVSTFALRLRENEPRVDARKRQRGNVVRPTSRHSPSPAPVLPTPKSDDELSSSESGGESDEEVDEVERDEKELNQVMQQVVATVFPVVSSVERDEMIDESIAQYEDPSRSPMNEIQPTLVDTTAGSTGDMVPRSELNTLRTTYEQEVERLKLQYVDGLQEYKRLVIEQYGRRQAIERERHRLEIEGLMHLIQTKFHAELSRRSERLKQAKESLKVLYGALRQHSGPAMEPHDYEEDVEQPLNAAMPLKTLLRAAILAMSTSATRNGKGRTQIDALHEQLTKVLPSPDTRTSAVAAAMTIHTAIRENKAPRTTQVKNNWCQTDPLVVLKERRSEILSVEQPCVALESLDGYILPGSTCFPRSNSVAPFQQELVMLYLVTGIPISAALISELRQLLPNLPPGNYYVSSALRLALFRELVRFYAAVEIHVEPPKPRPKREAEDHQIQDEVVIGSPRDTPFLRRKALETIESQSRQRNRRHLFTSGGTAILQTTPLFTSTSPTSR